MNTKPSLWLMLVMLMFPQIVETIYSPALSSIALSFDVNHAQAAQTLSIYFLAFAIGVVVWGVLADKLGRRPTMLIGLFIYGFASLLATQTESFAVVMAARALSAFGIAVGSVVTQTMLRDAFDGQELSKVFSLMGMGISISPVVGMLLGGQLTGLGGYRYVFFALFLIALVLLAYNVIKLPETQKEQTPVRLRQLSWKMVRDARIWRSGLLVALYNIALFSYYQLGAFTFSALGYSSEQFGYSGIVLGLGTLLGSYLNKSLVSKNVRKNQLLWLSAVLLSLGSVGVLILSQSIWFVAPMMLVVMSYGIAIPNILSDALVDYKQQVGSAGALFGLMYYIMIGTGLAMAGTAQNLSVILLTCSCLAILLAFSTKQVHTDL
ncbi:MULTISPECIES: multidrug effflux MFS transporter [Vibrio diabolicus subgroup]|uniref:MFS transporter n=1 Tax=Vibrio diabolicus TaxID=50719 RepID=A0AAX1XR69_9VIBR|nr:MULTISPECIES: multidrug effflux MFS transporter [Vibrio diabolicus subgroup]MCS0021566.1 multidrug effflux MFS transporter [Vibrio antiquarius]MCS0346255.1 multidrug effflux MFS transporter [Vibrio diabolicus]MCS0361887.1 multidrug effflux MFS transporter [Vibrio diabolicus]MCS0373183.1 multidrug effflux MFS transporter [Vibrio diabolicus]MCS0428262.1 multidrug effflux MFS transporter [Vibrio diabolicus]